MMKPLLAYIHPPTTVSRVASVIKSSTANADDDGGSNPTDFGLFTSRLKLLCQFVRAV